MLSKTPYELYKGRKSNISHLRSFGCKCFILNNGKHPIGKMDAKSDEAIFMGYALNSKAYRVCRYPFCPGFNYFLDLLN